MGDQDVTSWTEADIFAASAEAEHLAARKRRHGRGLGSVSDGAGTGSETKKPSQQKGVDKSSEVCREGSSTVKPLAEETGTMMASQAENLFHRRAAARMVARGTPASGSVPVRIRASPVVRLQVYDIWDFATRAGLPIYHLGVEVFGSEVYFSARGVQSCKPAGHRIHPHRETVELGETSFSIHEIRSIVKLLKQAWRMEDYNILGHNCQSFAVDFTARLGVQPIPWRYCCFSRLGGTFPSMEKPPSSTGVFSACCCSPGREGGDKVHEAPGSEPVREHATLGFQVPSGRADE